MFDHADASDLASTEFSTYAALEIGLISEMHTTLGNASGAAYWAAKANRTATMVHKQLWDAKDGFYYYRKRKGAGDFVRVKTVSGFAPLLLNGMTDDRVRILIAHLNNASEFASANAVPTVAMHEKTYSTNMWRGPAWTNTNLFVVLGLRKYGHVKGALEAADRIQRATVDMVADGYEKFGTSFEFYDSSNKVPPTQLARKGSANSGGVRDYHWTAANAFWMLHNKEGVLPSLT
jgi:neutral trehalase